MAAATGGAAIIRVRFAAKIGCGLRKSFGIVFGGDVTGTHAESAPFLFLSAVREFQKTGV